MFFDGAKRGLGDAYVDMRSDEKGENDNIWMTLHIFFYPV